MAIRLGELLLKENMVTPQQLQDALDHQKTNGGKLGRAFVSLGFVTDEAIVGVLSRKLGIPSVDLEDLAIDPETIKIIPPETAWMFQVLPLSVSGNTLTIAMANPTNLSAMDDIKFMTGHDLEPVLASEIKLKEAIGRYYRLPLPLRREPASGGSGPQPGGADGQKEAIDGPALTMDDLAGIGGLSEIDLDSMADAETDADTVRQEEDEIDLGELSRSPDAAPVIKLTNVLLVDSLKRGASHIHIEPYEKEFRVRFRIDGILYNVMALPMKLKDPLTSRIKTMLRGDIAERRLPQDGRIKIKISVEDRSREVDFRVSCLPTLWGEKIVMRLLDKSKLMLDMTKLGFEPHSLERFKNAINKPYGIVLVTGPTGSGKTNTLYSAIAALDKLDTNIMTAEDPVEFNLAGINQVQIRENIGLNFAAVLRSFLRQDPNIILVGDIRDYKTAEIAVKTALSGHLVLAAMNEIDALSAIEALREFGIHPLALGRALGLIVTQRLVRRVCVHCKTDITTEVPSQALVDIGVPQDEVGSFAVFNGKGCGACNGSGYKGRIGLFEVMETGEGIRDLITAGASAAEINKKAVEEGMITLQQSGLEKLKAGITTLDEVIRETAY